MSEVPDSQPITDIFTETTADIVSAYVGHNSISPTDLPKLIGDIYAALHSLNAPEVLPEEVLRPAVPIKISVTPDYLICLDDGKKFKSLKRHISTLGTTPEDYRTKWGAPRRLSDSCSQPLLSS